MPEIKTEEMKEPVYPYIKYAKIKKEIVGSTAQPVEEVKNIGYLRVDGCHGSPEGLTEFFKKNILCLGCGNLKPGKHDKIRAFVEARTGQGLHPALREPSVMEQKVERANRARQEASKNA